MAPSRNVFNRFFALDHSRGKKVIGLHDTQPVSLDVPVMMACEVLDTLQYSYGLVLFHKLHCLQFEPVSNRKARVEPSKNSSKFPHMLKNEKEISKIHTRRCTRALFNPNLSYSQCVGWYNLSYV